MFSSIFWVTNDGFIGILPGNVRSSVRIICFFHVWNLWRLFPFIRSLILLNFSLHECILNEMRKNRLWKINIKMYFCKKNVLKLYFYYYWHYCTQNLDKVKQHILVTITHNISYFILVDPTCCKTSSNAAAG